MYFCQAAFIKNEQLSLEFNCFIYCVLLQGELTVSVATSDLTAQGVDSETYEACMAMPIKDRGDYECGDYEHTASLVTFGKGQVIVRSLTRTNCPPQHTTHLN